MYLLKALSALLLWLLKKSLCTVVIALLFAGLAISSLICLPLVLLTLLHKQNKKLKNETHGND